MKSYADHEIDGPPAGFFVVKDKTYTYGACSFSFSKGLSESGALEIIETSIEKSFESARFHKIEAEDRVDIDDKGNPLLVWRMKPTVIAGDERSSITCRFVVVPPGRAEEVKAELSKNNESEVEA